VPVPAGGIESCKSLNDELDEKSRENCFGFGVLMKKEKEKGEEKRAFIYI
jgi:hypothetical protein